LRGVQVLRARKRNQFEDFHPKAGNLTISHLPYESRFLGVLGGRTPTQHPQKRGSYRM